MKEIKLKQVKMRNWRGQNHDITFYDGVTRISGVNSAGKSSIMHAFFWCISGFTEPHNPKNFNLYDNREELNENTPWASVEAEIEVDGIKYELQRRAKPKFTRSKGSMAYTKSPSDLYEYYVDSIEVGSTGFNNFIENTLGIPLDVLPYCLSGDFFSYLVSEDKNKARTMLTNLCGEINAEDFKGDYSSIAELLERYSASDIIEMSRKKKKPLEDRQNAIPNEIDLKEERLSQLMAMNFADVEFAIDVAKRQIEAIDGLLLGNADAIKPILEHNREIENRLSDLRRDIIDDRIEYEAKQNERTSEIKAQIAEVTRYNEGVERENAKRRREYDETIENRRAWEKRLTFYEEKRETLLKRRDEVKARVYTEETCAYCGQELPYEMLEKAREKFNETKAKDLEYVVKEGKATAEDIVGAKERIETLNKLIEEGYTCEEKKSTAELEEALKRVEDNFVPYEDTVKHDEIYAKIKACEREIREIPSNDNEALTSEKKALIEQLSELSKKLGLKDEIAKVENDIVELKNELRSVANSIAELEGHIFTAQAWLQERNEITALRINGKMKKASFEMWSKQKNGEQIPDLILTNQKGIRFSSTNFANQIELKLDLQELFNKTFDVNLPRFIDESAVFSPSLLPKFEESQVIYLMASDEETLTIR